jgi:hypothetical protein
LHVEIAETPRYILSAFLYQVDSNKSYCYHVNAGAIAHRENAEELYRSSPGREMNGGIGIEKLVENID